MTCLLSVFYWTMLLQSLVIKNQISAKLLGFHYLFVWAFPGGFGFPDSSVGKEHTCNAGDPGSIHGLRRSTGEGIGYPFQYSWASFVAQLVKNLSVMQETWPRPLGWEDPLEKGKATQPVFRLREFHELYSPWSHKVGHD